MKRKRGFTLIELLVVIAIIAMLMAVMLPALNLAKEKARRTVCQAHIRSIVTAMVAYAQDYKDNIPSSLPGLNAALNFYVWVEYPTYRGWINLGRLCDTKLIDDPAIFYCPSQKTHPILREEVGWTYIDPENGQEKKATSYMYGLLAQIHQRPELELDSLKLSQLRQRALICDAFLPVGGYPVWAHKGEGLSTAFGDAHVEFKDAGKQVANKAAKQKIEGSSSDLDTADFFTASVFEALRGNDSYLKLFGVRWGED